jgi:hypothetical protein
MVRVEDRGALSYLTPISCYSEEVIDVEASGGTKLMSVFIDFSNGGLGDDLRAQSDISNININQYYQLFMGAKGGDAWK